MSRVAGLVLEVLVAYLTWRDGVWTVRGQVAIRLQQTVNSWAERERQRLLSSNHGMPEVTVDD